MATESFQNLQYLSGFGNTHSSESPKCPGALPKKQYMPQKCPYGLYAEMLNGSSFTTPREFNQKSMLYRIRPSVIHRPYEPADDLAPDLTNDWSFPPTPNQISWRPFDLPEEGHQIDFVQSIKTLGGAGEPKLRHGMAIHVYSCNTSMGDKCFFNSDGDFLIVPQMGTLYITTEFGKLTVKPTEIVVIQQGIKFSITVKGPTRGYILEVFDNHFTLPELGAIGTHGLSDPRLFLFPVACFEERDVPNYTLYNKHQGKMFKAHQDHSPFDVVAYHGNYVPYKYDLTSFLAVSSVTFDHLDPSLFTVLTCKSLKTGTAIADFLTFPQRWVVQENTFRPPPFHRNCMTEFMGLVYGNISGEHGLSPGGASLHSMMAAHGPDTDEFHGGSNEKHVPKKTGNYVSFMFESCLGMATTNWAMKTCGKVDAQYYTMWQGLKNNFNPNWKPAVEEETKI